MAAAAGGGPVTGAARKPGRDQPRVLVFLAKLAVSAVLIGFLLSRLSLDEIRAGHGQSPLGLAAGGPGASTACRPSAGRCSGPGSCRRRASAAPAGEIRRLYFIGLFFNNFLPANIGGDAYKIVDLGRRENGPWGVLRHPAGPSDRPGGPDRAGGVVLLAGASLAGIPLPTYGPAADPGPGCCWRRSWPSCCPGGSVRSCPGCSAALKLEKLAEQLDKITDEFGLLPAPRCAG